MKEREKERELKNQMKRRWQQIKDNPGGSTAVESWGYRMADFFVCEAIFFLWVWIVKTWEVLRCSQGVQMNPLT